MAQGHLPAWLYNALPYLYAGGGALTIYLLASNWVAVGSGLLLITAGLTVWTLRFRYRRLRKHMAERRRGGERRQGMDRRAGDRRGQPSPVVEAMQAKAGFVRLTWRPEYMCGHPALDAQHRKLFEAGNALLNAILDQQEKLDVRLMLEDLIEHFERHFSDEAAIRAQFEYPIGADEQARRADQLAKAKRLGDLFHRDELTAGDIFTFVANDLVMQHIASIDVKFVADDRPAGEPA